jgi:hypothetical protein
MGRVKGSKNKKKEPIDEYKELKLSIEEKKKSVNHNDLKYGSLVKFIFAGYEKEGKIIEINGKENEKKYFCYSKNGITYNIEQKQIIEIVNFE